ncbi:hypothetical protein BDV93DRAFT_366927 [Ceratobasidium sp. AG-I]|nr:hypothetical protein BDV93DRAFT_366927 [Ceratobasidium sp. AG-I]
MVLLALGVLPVGHTACERRYVFRYLTLLCTTPPSRCIPAILLHPPQPPQPPSLLSHRRPVAHGENTSSSQPGHSARVA